MRIKFTLSTGYSNSDHIEWVEFEDDASDKEIDQACEDWVWEHISANWEKDNEL